jgi:hypothetical protein
MVARAAEQPKLLHTRVPQDFMQRHISAYDCTAQDRGAEPEDRVQCRGHGGESLDVESSRAAAAATLFPAFAVAAAAGTITASAAGAAIMARSQTHVNNSSTCY